MRIGIAADHGGLLLKKELMLRLWMDGYEVVDYGAYVDDRADDYPDFVIPMAEAIAVGEIERGIALCGSGVGASVCANKVPGVRAALIKDSFSARQGVEDDHINVICMGGQTEGPAMAWELVKTFLTAEFSQEQRHLRRVAKVAWREQQGTRHEFPAAG